MIEFFIGLAIGLVIGFVFSLFVACTGSFNKENEAFESGYIAGLEKRKKENEQ